VATKPKIQIDIAEVERLAGLGLTNAEICLSLGISETTLYTRKRDSAEFADAIKRGQAKAAADVANALYLKATGGDLGAIVWYEKTRGGRSDKQQIEHSGSIDVTRLSDEELDRMHERLNAGR
jgi:hypothetical protein